MKSEHRHELKTNELADWIIHLPDWIKANIKTIIYVLILIIVVAGLTVYKRYYKNVVKINREVDFTQKIGQLPGIKAQIIQAQSKGQDMSHLLLPYANTTIKDTAAASNNDLAAALALIKRAEALRADLHYRTSQPSQSEVSDRLNQAKILYTQALDLAEADPFLQANAKLGIGLCQEELGNIDDAKQIYTELSADKKFEGTTAVDSGKRSFGRYG